MAELEAVVTEARQLTPTIRELVLRAPDAAGTPAFEPGAHIELALPGEGGNVETRAYSVIGGTESEDDPAGTWRIAVERKVESRGGSRFLHDAAAPGLRLAIAGFRNEFPLRLHKAERVLIAGGIGIAPVYGMVRALVRRGIPFELHYAGPEPAQMAYHDEIARLAGQSARFHYEGGRLEFDPIFAALGYPAEVYVCGQRPFNSAAVTSAMEHGLSRMQILQQCFDPAPVARNDDTGFEVELRKSGISAYVPPDSSILETLLANGYPAQFYCGRGECGFCPLPVVEADGPIEHRDHYLSGEERREQMCICVSRIKGTRLVLDA